MTNEKWYNSHFFTYLGTGLGIAAICVGIGSGIRTCEGPSANQVEIEKARAKQVLQQTDLNGNGITDKFYVIDGKIAVVELDGKPVSNSLDTKVLEE